MTQQETQAQFGHTVQANVSGEIGGGVALTGQIGPAKFRIGGNDVEDGIDPYELLSASLAACTAMTIRHMAIQRAYPLANVEVAVSYRSPRMAGGTSFFERSIILDGDLDDHQRVQLLQGAATCPVSRALGVGVEIRPALKNDTVANEAPPFADYTNDLAFMLTSLVNVDPD
jgi:putative redox protein